MPSKWPWFKRGEPEAAALTAIYISAAAGEPMLSVDSVQALHDAGLQGDRYAKQVGFWQATDACQVTLIGEYDLVQAKKGQPAHLQHQLDHGGHRRNLVIGGVKTKALEGRTFRIGAAVFAYHKPRPPCGYLDKIEGKGLCQALGRTSGVCLRVVRSGTLAVGDAVELLTPDHNETCA